MPRITRIHFASLGHRDARFPSLTLDLRDPQGQAADTILWAENGTGKTSLLNLFFSTYQTSRRQFLGARSQAKSRDLEDYVQDRDLSFIITEWDTTDDRTTPALLEDGPREWLIVGQLLAWRGLDHSSGDLRRLFFTFRPNRDVQFETLPILGLADPLTSFEAFRDWLNEQAKRYPKLQVVTETNQGDWRGHLEANHLDPELFAYQLRMNLAEGGVNELFNDLRSDKDFIRLFLELGLDPDMPNRVRANLNEFLPKHRRLGELRVQVAFNERLLVDLGLFLDQLKLFEEAEEQAKAIAREASALLGALQLTKQRLTTEAAGLASDQQRLEREETNLTSAREAIRRRERFFTHHRMKLQIEEAEAERARANRAWSDAKIAVRLVDMAEWLGKLRTLESEASTLKQAIAAAQVKARPEREALERLGADYKFAAEAEAAENKARLERAQQEKASLHQQLTQLSEQRVELERETSARQQEVISLQQFFDGRERQRDRLRNDGLLQPKEDAAAAAERWQQIVRRTSEAVTRLLAERDHCIEERDKIAATIQDLMRRIIAADHRLEKLAESIANAEQREEKLATHPQMQAAVEAPRANLDLPQTMERVQDRAAQLLKQLLQLNLDGAEDQRATDYLVRHGLLPPSRDAEKVVEQLKAQGINSAAPATRWLADNQPNSEAATRLLAADPGRYQGVMFNPLVDEAGVKQVAQSLRSEHSAVQLSALPATMPKQEEVSSLIVLPRHAGAYNRPAAEIEAQTLQTQMAARTKELDEVRIAHDGTSRLLADLERWHSEFGAGKLAAIRERRRGEEQSLELLRERHATSQQRLQTLSQSILQLEAGEREQRELQLKAEKANSRLENFIEQFDQAYEEKRGLLKRLQQRLRELETALAGLADERVRLEAAEAEADTTVARLRDAERDLRKEIESITYVGLPPTQVREEIEIFRSRYRREVERFEGRFKSTAAQGKLEAVQEQIQETSDKIHRDFGDLDGARAKTILSAGDLSPQRREAEAAESAAHEAVALARNNWQRIREGFIQTPTPSELDQPAQGEPIPPTAVETLSRLQELSAEGNRLQSEHERVRDELAAAEKALAETERRRERAETLAKRLEDHGVDAKAQPVELPSDDAAVVALVDKVCEQVRRTREARQAQHEKLKERHASIVNLTQDDEFSREVIIRARDLFKTMPLEELMLVAGDKRQAVEDDTAILRDELDKMQTHRELIVGELLNRSAEAVRLLRRTEVLSRMPDDLTGWEGEPFLRIHLRVPPSEQEQSARLRGFVDGLLREGEIPSGVELVFRALLALVTEQGIEATILKPEAQRRRLRYPVREMGSWSEGEGTTVAILLYCTLVKLRAQSRGQPDRRAEVSALLLDNPIGPCSKPEFLQMQRWIASQLGVQLVYATGVNDAQALSVFPNRIRLAKNRLVPATGELAVGVVSNNGDSIVNEIRIFDRVGEAKS